MPIDIDERGQALENEYFRRKEQELIDKMKAKLAEEESKSLDIKCPKCDGTLVETDFEKIKIDVCDKCTGVWLDAGELTQIAEKDEKTGWFGKVLN
ncbi:MAG: zf-TFIIB domain-containing protein [Pyrinomonadaceae bacterium]